MSTPVLSWDRPWQQRELPLADCSPWASVPPALSLLFQRDGKLRPSWTTSASPASPSSPDHHISVPSVPLGCDKIPHVSPEIYVYTLLYIQCSPLITGMVTRQSVRGNKNRFPKLDIINSVPPGLKPAQTANVKVTLGGFCRSCWLCEQGVEPKGGKDLSWRCSFPPNNHLGTKWTFLRQNSKDSAIQKPFLVRIYFVSTTLDTPDGSLCISPATLNHHLHCNTFIVAHSQAQTVIDVQATLRREPREQPLTQVMELPPA